MSCPENIKRLSCWRHAEFSLGLFGRLLRRLEMSDHFSFFGKERDDRALGRVDNVVSVPHGKLAVDFQTELDEGSIARVPRPATCGRLDCCRTLCDEVEASADRERAGSTG